MIFKDDRLNSYKYDPSCEIKDDKYSSYELCKELERISEAVLRYGKNRI